jgi:asparagine N-glycosylation enzyme membrane subunit Stt3
MKEEHVCIIILSILCFTLLTVPTLMNSEPFNPDGDTLSTRFRLHGPDPYYNMRMCNEILESGNTSFTFGDPLLSYPTGTTSGRPPLFSMLAIFTSKLAEPFVGNDALGWAMLILPSIYSSLLIFPFYFLTKEIFDKKIAIFSTCFLPLIPLYISGSHSGVLSAFDHDSFILLMLITTMYFVVRMLNTNNEKSLLYCGLATVSASTIVMSWVVGETILVVILVFMFLKLIKDSILNLHDNKTPLLFLIMIGAWLISLQYDIMIINLVLFGFIITIYDFMRSKYRLPFSFTLLLIVFGFIATYLFYLIDLRPFSSIGRYIFTDYIYQSKVSMTIAEANIISISESLLLVGSVYIMFFAGLMKFTFSLKERRFQNIDLFFLATVIIYLYFTMQAGRFLFDMVPFIVILSSYFFIKLSENITSRISNNPLKLAVAFVMMIILISPNVYLTAKATDEPYQFATEKRWGQACEFLIEQNTTDAILTWWDYGFYISAMADIPVVADNFQNGIYPASNFFTAETESEALAVLITRILEPLDEYPSFVPQKIIDIMKEPTETKIYGQIIQPEYHNFTDDYVRGGAENAMYQSIISFLSENYTKEEIYGLYNNVCNYTGNRIGYIGIDCHDFVIAPAIFFSADKSVWLFTRNDSFFKGLEAVPTELVNNTMFYKMFHGYEMDYFKIYYETEKIKIFEVSNNLK